MSDASDNSTTVNKYLVPVTTDNIVLKWDGNTASLATHPPLLLMAY